MHPCPHQVPSGLSLLWLTLGRSRFPWQPRQRRFWSLFTQLRPSPRLPPAQPSSTLAAAKAAGPPLAADPQPPRDFKGFRTQWASGAFLSEHGPACTPASRGSALRCPCRLEPTQIDCSLIRKPSWAGTGIWRALRCISLTVSAARPFPALPLDPRWAGWALVQDVSCTAQWRH